MNLKKYIKNLTVLPILVLIFLSVKPIYAQSSLSIGAAPTSKTLELKAGDTYSDEIVFWNLSEDSDTYTVYIKGFKQIQNQPGTAIILSDSEDAAAIYSASKWIRTDKSEVELEPNKNIKVKYTITVPKDITNGEYNAEIFLISKNAAKSTGTVTYTSLASGMPILIKVGDEFVENAELLRFSTDKKAYEKPNVNFETKIKNLGDTHITPTGEIVIQNIFNQEIARISFNSSRQSLLRDNIGNYMDNWSIPGYLTADKKIAIGPLKANLLITYRSYQPGFATLSSQATFWIIPWKWIIGIFVVALTATIYKVTRKKNTQKR